jgi:hypothetical protein
MEHALVYMNRGRWVVECPHEGCSWAYMATTPEGAPRYQLQCEGGWGMRLDTGGASFERGCGIHFSLAWPPLDVALEVERLLFARPQKLTQNWRAPETVEGLTAENEAALIGWNLQRLAEAGIGGVE